VVATPFFFALEFSSQGVPANLLGDLAAQVLRHVGVAKAGVADAIRSLEEAVAKGSSGARCDVRFQMQPGKLEIVVSSNGGRVWQTSVPIA
jgi:hypothetical protein